MQQHISIHTDTKPEPVTPVTAGSNPLSGSQFYVYGKPPGEALDAAITSLNDGLSAQKHMLTGMRNITSSFVAGMGWANPFWGLHAQGVQSMVNGWLSVAQGVNTTLQRQLDQTTRDIFSNGHTSTREWADAMIAYGRALPNDDEVNEKLNNRFFTHYAEKDPHDPLYGALYEAAPQDVLRYFDPARPVEEWPNLILTSSHALVRNHQDVSGIMKGFHSLITHSFRDARHPTGRDLPLIHQLAGSDVSAEGRNPTIILSSVHNDGNAWINGGRLIHRLNHLDALYEQEAALAAEGQSEGEAVQQWREKAYIGVGDTAMSPAAIRLAKLLLQLIVKDPSQITMPTQQDMDSWATDPTQSLTHSDQPIALRDDADRVLQHIKLAGYSKGGNIVTDAMRYLLLELQHAPDGERQFQAGTGEKAHAVTDREIQNLLRHAGILCVNPGIAPLTAREKSFGIRRLTVRNEQDRITGHLFDRHSALKAEGKQGSDDIYVVNPKERGGTLGHGYAEALGDMEQQNRSGYVVDERRVKLETPQEREEFYELRSRLRAFFASCYEQVGISHITLYEDTALIGFSTGISAEQAQAVEKNLLDTLSHKGLHPLLRFDWEHGGKCVLYFGGENQEAWKKPLADAVVGLTQRPQQDIFIGHNAYRSLGLEPPELAAGKSR